LTISSASPFSERLRVFRLLIARGALKLRAGLAGRFSTLGQWRSRQPDRLLIAPQDIRTGDPTTAAEIYAGYYAFAGKIVNAHGRSPFSLDPPSLEWARILYGFSWLRHLRAANTVLARANARSLVTEFIATSGKTGAEPAWEPSVVARRTLAWLSQSPMLLEGVDYDDYRRFIRVLSSGYWLLRRHAHDDLAGEFQLTAAIAMTAFALCAQGGAPLLKGAVSALNEQLRKQILLDGLPVGRNPQTLVDLLFDLLPLRQAFAARGMSPPTELLNAIDRMTPALRMFRHHDGSLALFNGMGVTAPECIAIALSYDDARGQPIFNARYSGYQRLEASNALAIVDTGAPPPPLFSRGAHAGCLSFEFSLGTERIVVNCGNPGPRRPDLRASARTTAAHSTVTVNNVSSCLFSARSGVQNWFADEILSGPRHVPVTRDENDKGTTVRASHDGYQRRFGLIHERTLALEADGARLQGRDRLLPVRGAEWKDVSYAIRFHIHPSVTLVPIWEGLGVLLQTSEGAVLAFEAGGLPIDVEESIFFAAPEGARACEQIVVYGTAEDINEIAWSFALQAPQAVPEQGEHKNH
jgi:uncharacterized heparinase superfamily protein